ncbi:MAG: 50S ribosomal protein L29 [Alphaproteobacteria bacterium]
MSKKIEEFRSIDYPQLVGRLVELKKELMGLRFQKVQGSLVSFSRFGQIRKEVARIMTVLSERKLASGGHK